MSSVKYEQVTPITKSGDVKKGYKKGESFWDHQGRLCSIAKYLLETEPADIRKEYILEVSRFLNELHKQAFDSKRVEPINMLNEALAKASVLKSRNEARDLKFFRQVKPLGGALWTLGTLSRPRRARS